MPLQYPNRYERQLRFPYKYVILRPVETKKGKTMSVQEKYIKENKMGTMPINKLVFNMSMPLMASMLFQALYNIVDSIFVAKLSQDAMNAVSLAFPAQTLLVAVAAGTGVGINALLSRSLGLNDHNGVDRAANTGIFLVLCSTLIFSTLGLSVSESYYRFQTTNPQIITYGKQYLSICVGFCLPFFGQVTGERLLQSTGRTDLAMIPQISGAVFNMIFDPILIFGLFGFPRLEVSGAAVATVCGQTLATFIAFLLNIRKNKEIHIRLSMIRFHRSTAFEIYRIGVPSILMQAIGSVMNFFLNNIVIHFTEAATAVFGAYYKIQSFIFMPVFGLNNAIVPIAAFNHGAGNQQRVRQTVKIGIFTAMVIMTAGAVLFESIPGTLLNLFSPTDEMLSVGLIAFRVIGVHFPVAGFCIVTGAVCQALGKPLYSLITSVCRQLVVLLPAAYLLSLSGKLALVWFAFPIAEVFAAILNILFLRRTLNSLNIH